VSEPDTPAGHLSWHLSPEEATALLGNPQDPNKLALINDIHRALHALYPEPIATDWIRIPNTNPVMGGDTPLKFMTSHPADIQAVLQLLLGHQWR
jgi:Protein of unknown function (DUF2384)